MVTLLAGGGGRLHHTLGSTADLGAAASRLIAEKRTACYRSDGVRESPVCRLLKVPGRRVGAGGQQRIGLAWMLVSAWVAGAVAASCPPRCYGERAVLRRSVVTC